VKTYVALLRGVNVGGRTMVSMAGLRSLLEELGYEDARTYIQSGNALFRAAGSAAAIAKVIEQGVEQELGVGTTVLLRTSAELTKVARKHPFGSAAKVHVVFLSAKPTAARVKALDPPYGPGEELLVAGREVYLNLPQGVGRTKLSLPWLERALGVEGTKRSWNTVVKLAELCETIGT
jgi:uncharacterized protein (DUF1697 family)